MAKILILGDVLRDEDRRKGSPVPGYILEGLLAQAGISPSECEFDVVFQTDSSFHTLCTSDGAQASSLVGRYQHSPKLFLHQAHDHHILRIRAAQHHPRPWRRSFVGSHRQDLDR